MALQWGMLEPRHAAELDALLASGRPALSILGAQVSFRARPGRRTFVREAWVFEIIHPRQLEELLSAARSVAEALGGGLGAPGAGWRVLIASNFEARESAERAARDINQAAVAFAALAAWGCGPVRGGAHHTSAQGWLPGALERLLEAAEIERSLGSAPGRGPGPRL